MKEKILSVFCACSIAICATISPYFVAQSQAAEITLASGKAVNAKVVLTAALAAGGLIAMGEAQGAVTAAQKAEIRAKVGQLEDQFISQEIKRADSQVQTATYIKDGVTHYVPIIKAGIVRAASAAASKISYVSKDFLSSWYQFLHQEGVWSTGLPDVSVGDTSILYSGPYSSSVYALSGSEYVYNTNVRYNISTIDSPVMTSHSISNRSFPHRLVAIPAVAFGNVPSGQRASMRICYFNSFSDFSTYNFIVANMPFELGGLPLFIDLDAARSYSLGLSNDGVLNIDDVRSSYSFGLTKNLPVQASDVFWPKTWVGTPVSDLPISGVTITDAPDLPDLTIPDLGQDVVGTAVPIDLGADIPDLWTEGGEVSADVVSGIGVGTGELPWDLPVSGDLPFPIPGVAFPGTIPAEDTWPGIQDKVQTGEFDGTVDVPLPGVADAWPSIDNAPTDEQVETAADNAIDWAIGSITLPAGLFDKVPFCIPYDCYLLTTSVLLSDASGGGQIDPSGVSVVSDGVAVNFGSPSLSWRSAPHIRSTVHLPLGKGIDIPIDIDCSKYDYFAALVWYGTAFIWTALILVSISRSFGRM